MGKKFEKLGKDLEQRCSSADADIVFEKEDDASGDVFFMIGLPCGREKRWLSINDTDDAKQLLSTDFEKYSFIKGYYAIYDCENGVIEAAVLNRKNYPIKRVYHRLTGNYYPIGKEIPADSSWIELTQRGGSPKPQIILGTCTKHLLILSQDPTIKRNNISIKIKNIKIDRHDEAKDLLEKVSNSLFFSIDFNMEIPLSLVQYRDEIRIVLSQRKRDKNIQFPTREFDKAPMALYLYARSIETRPLGQFLAFYQVLEYYFPVHAEQEKAKMVGNIIKEPDFNPDRPSDLGRILLAVQSKGPFGFGSEKSQLKATLKSCLEPESLLSFINEDKERKDFFSQKAKRLTDKKFSKDVSKDDLLDQITERIYDIRCKIVHTKSDESSSDYQILLPFSEEEKMLFYDIELLKYIAQKIIISSSSLFRI